MAQRFSISPTDVAWSIAKSSDLDSIIAIEEQSFPTPWSRTALSAYVGEAGFVVCCYQERLVGYILAGMQIPSLLDRLERLTMSFLGADKPAELIGHVMNLAVHPDFRGCGLGRSLLQRGLTYLKDVGASRVDLEVRVHNATAIRLYESHGFAVRQLLKGYYQNGDDAFLMSKSQF